MKRARTIAKSCEAVICASLIALALTCTARAEVSFDPNAYSALAAADSTAAIPEGTRITRENWSQYKKFMPVGMQALFGGGYKWQIDATPDSAMVVGPTIPTQQPKQFLTDTEKYTNQVQLIKLPQGSYT